jgi:hypothetical protein
MFRTSYNLAGIKRSKLTPDAPVRPGGTFRHYPGGYVEALDDWVRVMSLPFYTAVRAAGSPEAACRALGVSPWDARHYRGRYDTNEPGHALLAVLPFVVRLAPITPRSDLVPTVT